MKRFIKHFNFREESGTALVLVALAMVALLGFTAIAIDGGRLYIEKSKLQKALDAAVLAGIQDIPDGESAAITLAQGISIDNGYVLSYNPDPQLTEVEADENEYMIKAKKTVEVPMTFAKVLNLDSLPVTASAKAVMRPFDTASGVVPIGIEKSVIDQAITEINEEEYSGSDVLCSKENQNGNNNSGQYSPGNCGFLDFEQTRNLKDEMTREGRYSVDVHSFVRTETGGIAQAKHAIQELITSDSVEGRTYCNTFETADKSCRRVINVVVLKNGAFSEINGTDEVEVIGFAGFWIEDFDDQGQEKYLKGKFMRVITPGELNESNVAKDQFLYGVKLSE